MAGAWKHSANASAREIGEGINMGENSLYFLELPIPAPQSSCICKSRKSVWTEASKNRGRELSFLHENLCYYGSIRNVIETETS